DHANRDGKGDLYTLLAPVVQSLATGLLDGTLSTTNLGALLDWRKAKPNKKQFGARVTADQEPSGPELPINPALVQHFIAIQAALDPDEAAMAREVARELAPAEVREWFDELSKLSVSDAVARVRALIVRYDRAGAA